MRRNGALDLEHHMFSDLPDCLPEGSLLVANNSRVLQARLLGSRSTGGKVEFLLLTQKENNDMINPLLSEADFF